MLDDLPPSWPSKGIIPKTPFEQSRESEMQGSARDNETAVWLCIPTHIAVKYCNMFGSTHRITGIVGLCGSHEVFLGFAPARLLHAVSFADILEEGSRSGYQRPRNVRHSRDFRDYIQQPGSSTIPLTFNLRPEHTAMWQLKRFSTNRATLTLSPGAKSLAQVDCQHRLGELANLPVPLAFMTFIGLDLPTEKTMFTIINSKAKGLSKSLTDYHLSTLMANVVTDAPHLYIARRLNDDPKSPWSNLIRLGGNPTPGTKRRTSLRMMQRAVAKFLARTHRADLSAEHAYTVIVTFWRAVAMVFQDEWNDPRHHLLTKGIGLHSLMHLLADIVNASERRDQAIFVSHLAPLKAQINWRSNGMFSGIGGQRGAMAVYERLRGVLTNANPVG